MTPVQHDSGPVFEVSGAWKLTPDSNVMPVVARDGIEPPTPAFSGLSTDHAKWFKRFNIYLRFSGLEGTRIRMLYDVLGCFYLLDVRVLFGAPLSYPIALPE